MNFWVMFFCVIFVKLGENPLVVTDATCYMGWIAEQYRLKLPEDYERKLRRKPTCTMSSGNINDVNKAGTECRLARGYEGPQLSPEMIFSGQAVGTGVILIIGLLLLNKLLNPLE